MQHRTSVGWLAELLGKLTNWELPPHEAPYAALEQGARLADPVPNPWVSEVALLSQAAQAKALAARLHESQKTAMIRSADAAIEVVLEDWCGTPPRRIPWPWPGPPPWVWDIASSLTLLANQAQASELRESLLDISARVVERGLGAKQGRATL